MNATNSSANTLGETTASALGGGSNYTPGAGVSAPSYQIQGNNYNNVGTALGAVNNNITNINDKMASLGNSVSIVGAGLNSLSGRVDGLERKAMQGVAVAGAMVAAPMPSEPGKTRVKVNNIFYLGYGATAVSVAHRLHTNLPAALTAGASFGYRNTTMLSVGAEVEF